MALTIPATWSPSSDCLASTDLWKWQKLSTAPVVLGGPAETSSCYPPGYNGLTSLTFQATACPSGFSQACVDADMTTCCPTAYEFTCNHNSNYAYLDATTFPCTSYWPNQGVTTTLTVTYTKLGARAESVDSYVVTRVSGDSTEVFTTFGSFTTTQAVNPGSTLFAMGVAISAPTAISGSASSTDESNSATDTSATATSTTPAPTSTAAAATGGLSAGAAAGIGVGVAVAVIAMAAAAFFVYRRRRKSQHAPSTVGYGPQDASAPPYPGDYGKPNMTTPAHMATPANMTPPAEMAANEQPRELPT